MQTGFLNEAPIFKKLHKTHTIRVKTKRKRRKVIRGGGGREVARGLNLCCFTSC